MNSMLDLSDLSANSQLTLWTRPTDRQEKYDKIRGMIGIPVKEHVFDTQLFDILKSLIEVCTIIHGT